MSILQSFNNLGKHVGDGHGWPGFCFSNLKTVTAPCSLTEVQIDARTAAVEPAAEVGDHILGWVPTYDIVCLIYANKMDMQLEKASYIDTLPGL